MCFRSPAMENRNPYKKKNLFSATEEYISKLLGFGVVVFVVSIFCFIFGVPELIKWRVELETQLRRGTPTWDKWIGRNFPIYVSVRVFNITNPDAIEKKEKFRLQELGPYVFEEKTVKTIVNADEEADTITYYETTQYIFRPDLSQGDVEDAVNVINIPYLTMVRISDNLLEEFAGLMTGTFDMMIQDKEIVKRGVKVGQLIFNGYEVDPLYEFMADFAPNGLPEQLIDGKFALLNGKNDSKVADYKMKSGIHDSSTFGEIITYNGVEELPFYTDKSRPPDQQYCNQINGSDGLLYPPFITKDRIISVFTHFIKRSLSFAYDHDIDFRGIPGNEFHMLKNMFGSPETSQLGHCFCTKEGKQKNDTCFDGAQRAFNAFSGAPILISKPHFLHGDPALVDGVEGLRPNPDEHESFLQFEPLTGHVLKGRAKVQLSVEIQPSLNVEGLSELPHVVVPVVWGERYGEISQDYVDFISHALLRNLRIVAFLQWTYLTGLGLLILVGFHHRWRTRAVSPKKSLEPGISNLSIMGLPLWVLQSAPK